MDALVGPIVASEAARAAELDVSLLERLFERPLYSGHRKDRDGSTTDYQISDIPFTNLVKVCGKALLQGIVLDELLNRTIEVILQSSCRLLQYFTTICYSPVLRTARSLGVVFLTRSYHSCSSEVIQRRHPSTKYSCFNRSLTFSVTD